MTFDFFVLSAVLILIAALHGVYGLPLSAQWMIKLSQLSLALAFERTSRSLQRLLPLAVSLTRLHIMAVSDNVANESLEKEEKTHQFSICSFNVWCPYWNKDEHKDMKLWKARHNGILNILCNDKDNNENNDEDMKKDKNESLDSNNNKLPAMNCDIYCIQEYWCGSEAFVRMYENYLKARNYEIHFLKRKQKNKPDGIAVIFNKNTFKFKNKLEFKYTINNRVALLVEVEHKPSKCSMMIGATHLTFPQDDYDLNHVRPQLGKELLELMQMNTSNTVAAQMLVGDFNCDINGNETVMCIKDGYCSAFHTVNKDIKGKIVSHFNHNKESVCADHIFYKSLAFVF